MSEERLDPSSGPLGNLSQAYFGCLDAVVQGYEPALRGVGRWNLELMGLLSRRARAWLEIPSRISQCKTPQDLINEQMRFWQTAAHQYADGSRRLTAALGACAVVPGFNGAWGGRTVARARDYINVSEAKDQPGSSAQRRSADRRAA
jgi:hypothetical protein